MKILHLISSLGIGGAERFVADLAIQQSISGHQAEILMLESAREADKDENYEKNLINKLADAGIKCSVICSSARKSPFKVLKKLKNIIEVERPDVVHSHMIYWSLYLSICRSNYRHIFTQHINSLKYPLLHKYYLSRFIDGYIGICDEAIEHIERYIATEKVYKVVNGVDDTRFDRMPTDKARYDSSTNLKFVTISRLTEQKNHISIINAVERILVKYSDSKFVVNIVGDGPLKDYLENIVTEKKLENYFNFLGTRSDVVEILFSSDVFLLPSHKEGFSIALIEAVASGIDIIATDVGGNSEILRNGDFGSLISLNQDDLYNSMVERINSGRRIPPCNKFHLKSLGIEACCKNHNTVYQSSILRSRRNVS